MQVDPETLKAFKKALDEEYGVAHTGEEVFEAFTRLVNVLRTLLYPKPRQEGPAPPAEAALHKKF